MRGAARSWGGLRALELGMERAERVDEKLEALAELRVAALVECPFSEGAVSALPATGGVKLRRASG